MLKRRKKSPARKWRGEAQCQLWGFPIREMAKLIRRIWQQLNAAGIGLLFSVKPAIKVAEERKPEEDE